MKTRYQTLAPLSTYNFMDVPFLRLLSGLFPKRASAREGTVFIRSSSAARATTNAKTRHGYSASAGLFCWPFSLIINIFEWLMPIIFHT